VDGAAVVYDGGANDGRVTFRRHEGTDLEAIALEVLALDRPAAYSPRGDSNQRDGSSYGRGYVRTDLSPPLMVQVYVFPYAKGGAVSMYSEFPATSFAAVMDHQKVYRALGRMAEAGDALPTDGIAVAEAEDGRAPAEVPTSPGSAPSGIERGGSPGLSIETVVFDLDYLYGLGGMATPEYEPVYLLEDGRACQCGKFAAGDLTEAVLSSIEPGRRGTWRRDGSGYRITYADGSKPEEVDGDLSLPLPLPNALDLVGRYQALGGGGNIAFGGDVMTAAVEDLTFFPDGSFTQANFSFGSTTIVTAWGKRGTAGTWALEGSDLTLEYRSGETVRTSVFFSEKRGRRNGSDPYGVLWIGGEDFKKR